MPKYNFINKKTNEKYTLWCSIAEMEQHVKDNPDAEQEIGPLHIGDPVGLGTSAPPRDFQKYVLGRVKANHPKGSVEKRWTIPKEV